MTRGKDAFTAGAGALIITAAQSIISKVPSELRAGTRQSTLKNNTIPKPVQYL